MASTLSKVDNAGGRSWQRENIDIETKRAKNAIDRYTQTSFELEQIRKWSVNKHNLNTCRVCANLLISVIPSAIGGDTCDTLSLVRYLRPRRTRCLISFSCDSRFTQMSYFTDPAFLVTEALSSTVIPLAYICLFNKECAPHSTQV